MKGGWWTNARLTLDFAVIHSTEGKIKSCPEKTFTNIARMSTQGSTEAARLDSVGCIGTHNCQGWKNTMVKAGRWTNAMVKGHIAVYLRTLRNL